jgi:aldehyde:ferredoxin oxidoreductase
MNLQRLFNNANGLTFAADLGDEAKLDAAAAGELAAMLQRYYDEHGWDADGIPTDATLERLGLTTALERDLVTASRRTTRLHAGAQDDF